LYRPARLGIDSWAPEKVYKYGLWKLNIFSLSESDLKEFYSICKGEYGYEGKRVGGGGSDLMG
jgi:hypothetical protein